MLLPTSSLAFRVHVPDGAFGGAEKDRVVVYLNRVQVPDEALTGTKKDSVVVNTSRKGAEPRFGLDWFDPQPCYSVRLTAQGGAALTVDDGDAVGFPGRLSALPKGEYIVQAVLDRDLGGRSIAQSPGNLYSRPVKLALDPATSGTVDIDLTEIVKDAVPKDTALAKYVAVPSSLLSRWYGRPTTLKATVFLPKAFDGTRSFPAIYTAMGFGAPDYIPVQYAKVMGGGTERGGKTFVSVVLDANCPGGHSAFADSANNGPWGKALVTELIPALERRFHLQAKPSARLLTGHSSGGWTSLWLQIAYPDFFGGVWSTSPDPVDFHDFQRIDLYARGANMFTDASGTARPLARINGKPTIFYKAFSDMERPIRGEQLGSFEWAFSPRGADGLPRPLWNRDTGAVDPTVAAAWRPYDIADKLRRGWPILGPKLKGKLHVYCGTEDTFYLDGAVRRLKAELTALHSDAEVEMVPGDHFTLMSPALQAKIDAEMAVTQK